MGAAFYVIRRSAGDSEYYDEEYEDYEVERSTKLEGTAKYIFRRKHPILFIGHTCQSWVRGRNPRMGCQYDRDSQNG